MGIGRKGAGRDENGLNGNRVKRRRRTKTAWNDTENEMRWNETSRKKRRTEFGSFAVLPCGGIRVVRTNLF